MRNFPNLSTPRAEGFEFRQLLDPSGQQYTVNSQYPNFNRILIPMLSRSRSVTER